MKEFFAFTMAILFTHISNAQTWEVNYGDNKQEFITNMCLAKDGFLLCGYAGFANEYYSADSDMLLIKIDSSGNKIWEKTFDSTVMRELLAVAPTSQGGFIGVGNQGASGGVLYLMKIDSLGNMQSDYVSSYPGKGTEVIEAADGGFIVLVQTYYMSGAHHVLKFDQNLQLLWDYAVGYSYPDSWFSLKDICEGNNNSVLLSGSFSSTIFYDGGSVSESYLFIDELSSNGILQTRHKYHDVAAATSFGGNMVRLDDGNLLLTGTTNLLTLTIKLAPDFTQIYDQLYIAPSGYGISKIGKAAGNGFFLLEIKSDGSGTNYSSVITKFNSDGFYEYTLDVKTSGEFLVNAAKQTQDNCFIAVGYGDSTGNYAFDPYAWGVCAANTSVQQIESQSEFLVFPNPLSLNQSLSFGNLPQGEWEITAYDISEHRIFSDELNSTHSLSMPEHFVPGIFIVHVKNKLNINDEHVFKLVVTPDTR